LLSRIRLVGEVNHQFALLHGDERLWGRLEAPLFPRLFLHVAVLAFGRIHQPKMHAHRVFLGIWPQAKGVVAQVLARFDVVLVGVGPVELDLLALVGDGVDAFLVAAQRDKVPLVVVAAEEIVEVAEDLILQGRQIDC